MNKTVKGSDQIHKLNKGYGKWFPVMDVYFALENNENLCIS